MEEHEHESSSNSSTIPLWKVIFHNDNSTTYEFVIYCLVMFFKYSEDEANKMATEIHTAGSAVVQQYHKELAEFKRDQVISLARSYHFPLYVSIEQ